jgi:hypothetical protein
MTQRTPQCELFWALLSNSKHSGVPEDSKSPTLGVLGFTPTLAQSGVATSMLPLEKYIGSLDEHEAGAKQIKLDQRRRVA